MYIYIYICIHTYIQALEAFVACRAPTAACAVMDGLLGVLLVHVTPRVPAITRLGCLL